MEWTCLVLPLLIRDKCQVLLLSQLISILTLGWRPYSVVLCVVNDVGHIWDPWNLPANLILDPMGVMAEKPLKPQGRINDPSTRYISAQKDTVDQ
jgi:hypothetical protein